MVNKKYLKYIIVGLFGLFYLVLPHEIHVKYSPDWLLGINLPHWAHLALGVVLLIWSYKIWKK